MRRLQLVIVQNWNIANRGKLQAYTSTCSVDFVKFPSIPPPGDGDGIQASMNGSLYFTNIRQAGTLHLTFTFRGDGSLEMQLAKNGGGLRSTTSLSLLKAGTSPPEPVRFDEKTDFTQAIAQLTGLKPLEDLGKRAQRIVTRLRKDEKQATEDARTEKARTFGTAKQAALDTWKAQDDLGDPADLLLPGELKNAVDCGASIVAARTGLERAQRDLAGAVETILGRRLDLAN
jgi:hypothetical protein